MSNKFIFVVCGAQEHIDTLHFSLEYLKRYSKNEIWILTDSTRNEVPIIHDKIVDVSTPLDFDHHQASIYLKTGIHRFFPKGSSYCYLDTDIIAFSEDVDEIFNQYQTPISFAPDHCTMNQFSPYAVHCDCLKENQYYLNLLSDKMDELDEYRTSDDIKVKEFRKELQLKYQTINSRFLTKIFFGIKFILSWRKFKLTKNVYCDRKNKVWIKDGVPFMKQINLYKVCKGLGLKWSFLKMEPITPNGKRIWGLVNCDHLQKAILSKYQIKPNIKFQHWNGGVFLFNDDSHDFLNTWHQTTMETFKDPYWKTRDQGTLIKTVWQMGLQNHPTLNHKWNLIADYYNPFLKWIDTRTIQLKSDEFVKPVLIHVYHHFGDKNWDFWNFIEKKS